jgi:hypothetical protein
MISRHVGGMRHDVTDLCDEVICFELGRVYLPAQLVLGSATKC